MRSKVVYPICIIALASLAYWGVKADERSFVGSLFAGFLSVVAVVFVEAELRPEIRIVREATPPVQPNGRKFLRVIVENRPLWWPLNLIMDRRPAYQARAYITFLTETNNPVFAREMVGRWSNTPEPVRAISVSRGAGGDPAVALMWDLSITRDAVDIASGASEPLDVVMRVPGEDRCRGWHNRMIQRADTPAEDRFELAKGRYNVLVRVQASGRSFRALFRVVCDVGIEDFRLESLPKVPRGL